MKGIAVLALLALVERPAHAGSTCGGGSDGGQSSSGSSDSSSSSSESSFSDSSSNSGVAESTPACIDDTDVVGFRKCTRFGVWGRNMRMPKLFLELGTGVRQFGSGVGQRTGHISHGAEQFAFRTVMPPAGEAASDTAVTTTVRLGMGTRRGIYAGVEGELGGVVSPAAATAEMMSTGTFGAPDVQQQNGLVVGVLGIAGIRGGTGRASFALEGAGGVRHVRYNFQSTYHHCIETSSVEMSRAVVEARARGEVWLNPWLTAGATLGSNVLDRGDWMAGVFFGFHSRAFAGSR